MRVRAVWKGTVLAESDSTRVVEGNHYFPPEAVKQEFLVGSDRKTVCPWKGVASYYDVVIGENRNAGAAWTYPEASDAAKHIENYIAFWQGVRVEKADDEGGQQGGFFNRIFKD